MHKKVYFRRHKNDVWQVRRWREEDSKTFGSEPNALVIPHKSRSGDSASLHHRLCMMSSLRDYRKKHQTPTNQRKTQGHLQISMRIPPPHCFRLAPLAENTIHQEIPAVGYPPYVCRHVLAFSSNLFGSI
ncbi:MAG: hypothetical protein LBQ66_03750, partial [Planctomycetaceae bacterium]|nr:hypothetical protein [Planctomycetaceae bacterium]